jgi:hypothetical protein
MAKSFIFKTDADGLIDDPAQLNSGLITGDKLDAAIDLPAGTFFNGTSLSTQITAAAGGYDFHESVRTVIRLLAADKGVGWDYGNTPHVLEVVNASYDLTVAGPQNCGVPLALTNRVAVMVVSTSIAAGPPAADEATGIYVLQTYDSVTWGLVRATDANSSANFNRGALTFLGEAVTPLQAGQGLVLVNGEYEDPTSVWAIAGAAFPSAGAADEVLISTGAGTSYTTKLASDLVTDVLDANLGAQVLGTAIISDGAAAIMTTSADVSTFLASADVATARTNLGLGNAACVNSVLLPVCAPAASTTSTVDVVLGGIYFDPSSYAITGKSTVLSLEFIGQVVAGVTGTITLYNVTDAANAATATFTTTTATFDTEPVAAPAAAKVFELRLKKSGGAVADYALVYGVNLRVTWS